VAWKALRVPLSKNPKMVTPSPGWPFPNPLPLLSRNLADYRLWLR
jgi:hypothetical protein